METNAWWVIPALFALGLIVLSWSSGGGRTARTIARSRPYHCVAVNCAPGACEQARRMRGRRMLSDEAPLLPLPGCRARNCSCLYMHFEDRRQASRRQAAHSKAPHLAGRGHVIERRAMIGRRKSDLLAAP